MNIFDLVDPEFNGTMSSDELWYAGESNIQLTDVIDAKSDYDHTHSGYALTNHSHSGYASADDLAALEDVVDTKADASHTHDGYALSDHEHSGYATQVSLDELSVAVSGKANASHNHDGIYDESGSASNALASANAYTDSKINLLVGEGAAEALNTIGEISSAIEDNQDAIDLLNSAIGSKANTTDLTSHANDTDVHITSAERTAWNAKSNFSGSYNDLTNKPTIPSVAGLATETYVDEKVAAVTAESIGALPDTTVIPTVPTNVSAFTNDAGYLTEHQSLAGLATETYVDEAVSTKANATHTHAISDVSGLQSSLDSKAASDHNHNTSYDALGAANTALNSAKEYTDDAIADEATARDSAIATAKSSAISTAASDATTKVGNHNTSTSAHSDIRTLIADLTTKLNNFLDVDDTTTDQLSEVITLINNNKGTLESLTTSKINVSDIVDNLTTSNASKVLSAKQGVAIKTLIDALQNELDTHTHVIADVFGLQSALDGKAASSHGTHVTYSTTAPVMDGTASVGSASTVARSDHKHPVDTSRAAQTDLDALETVVAGKANSSHTHTIANVTNLQSSLDAKQATITGGASTIASANLTSSRALVSDSSGKVAVSAVTSTELGYLDGVTSNVQTQLDSKAASSHTHSAATTSAAGFMSASDKSKLDGIASGANAYTLPSAGSSLGGVKTGGDVTISSGVITVNDDSHNHIISNIDGLQSALDGKSASSHTHTAQSLVSMADALFATSYNGGVEFSYAADSGANILTQISSWGVGIHTAYAAEGISGNPKTTQAWRYLCHKVTSTIGWVIAFGSSGDIYTNYLQDSFKGWRRIYEVAPATLWSHTGQYMAASHTATPSKALSECANGWLLIWSDYDAGSSSQNLDFCTTIIPKKNYVGEAWSGQKWLCTIPYASDSDAGDKILIKTLHIYDDKIVGDALNNVSPRNDVCLRAIYEY